jgi:hypothetical protein
MNLAKVTFVSAGILVLLLATFGRCDTKRRAISGTVTDEADAPIPNAVIELQCSQGRKTEIRARDITNSSGQFRIESTLNGSCSVRVTHSGFSPVLMPVVASDKSAAVDLGKIRLRVSCSGSDVVCDEVTPN